jgi:hypothetical protein
MDSGRKETQYDDNSQLSRLVYLSSLTRKNIFTYVKPGILTDWKEKI